MSPQQVVLPWPGLAHSARLSAGASRAHRGWRVRARNRRRARPPARAAGRADALLELLEGPAAAGTRARRTRRRRARAGPPAQPRVAPARLAARRALRRPDRHRPLARIRCSCRPARATQVVTIHDLDFLDHPERTRAEIRRDYARARAGARAARPRPSSRSRSSPPDEIERRLGVAARSHRHLLARARRPGRRAPRAAPRGPILFMGTLEPRKNVGALLARLRASCCELDAGRAAAVARRRRRPRRRRRGCARSRAAAARAT